MDSTKNSNGYNSFMSPREIEYLQRIIKSVKRRAIAASVGVIIPFGAGATVAIGSSDRGTLPVYMLLVSFVLVVFLLAFLLYISKRNRGRVEQDLSNGMKETKEVEVLKKLSMGRRRRAVNAFVPVSKRRYYYVSTDNGWYELRLEDYQAVPAHGKITLQLAPVSKVVLGIS
jgi:hypothetical protein